MSLMAATAMLVTPVLAQPEVTPFSLDAMGCMKLGECTDGVKEVYSMEEIEDFYGNPGNTFSLIEDEADDILSALKESGVKVFIAEGRYFPVDHRGVYYPDDNVMFLNAGRLTKAHHMINLLRHEGWHAAQDCMAGSIDNRFIAVIFNDELIPQYWKDTANRLYPASVVPWEQEAKWIGSVEGETTKALEACSTGAMWEIYEPTPMTREWLEANGHL